MNGRPHPALLPATLLASLLASLTAPPAARAAEPAALRLWHAGTVAANMGQCAVVLSVDGQGQQVSGLRLRLAAVDGGGSVQARGEARFADFGASHAERYQDASWAAEALCDEGLTLRIEQAHARIDGQRADLLAQRLLQIEDFRPLPIRLGPPAAKARR